MSDLFVTKENNYNLGDFQELESSLKRTVKFETETISYSGPQIWNLIPERLSKGIGNIKQILKRNKKMEVWCPSMLNVQSVHSMCWLY